MYGKRNLETMCNNDIDVSIIIPVYNAEKYIKQCVESILKQTLSSWELILVDDGSKDNSLMICQDYAEKYSNIVAIHQMNGGSSVARNTGLRNANGRYIAFIDADDWIDSRMLEILINKADECTADIVICNYFNVYTDGRCVLQPKSGFGEWVLQEKEDRDIFLRKYLCKGIKEYRPYLKVGFPWAKVYSHNLIKENDLFFPEGLARTEDGIFNMYAIENARKVIFLDEGLYYYRLLEESISHCYYPNIVRNTERDFEEVKKFATKYKKNDDIFNKGISIRIATWFYKYLKSYYFTPEYLKKNGYARARKEILSLRNQQLYEEAYRTVDLRLMTTFEKIFVVCMKYRWIELCYLGFKLREKAKCQK